MIDFETTLKAKEDPKLFVELFLMPPKLLGSGKPRSAFTPFDHQVEWLEKSTKPINCLAAGNRGGKSTVTAFKHIWRSFYKIGCKKRGEEFIRAPYETLNVAPDYKQALIVWTKIEHMMKNSKELAPFIAAITTGTRKDPHAVITLANGSRIHAISSSKRGERIYGFDYDYISFDECAAEPHLEEIIENVLKTRLFDRGGLMDLVTTPMGYNTFFNYWKRGIGKESEYFDSRVYDPKNYFSYNFASTDNPFVEQDKIQEYMETQDESIRKERIEGLFVDLGINLFSPTDIEECTDYDLELESKVYTGHQYIGGLDLGRKGDATSGVILDISRRPFRLVDFLYIKEVSWEYIMYKIAMLNKKFQSEGGTIEWTVDSTGMGGDMAMAWLNEIGVFALPFHYTPARKVNLLNNLQKFLENHLISYPQIDKLKEELKFYKLEDKKLETDCVMALALACWHERQGELPLPYKASTMPQGAW